jgi:hypothetical protein
MPVAAHTKAAETHMDAAQAHKSAADLHSKGDHAGAGEKSAKAQGCCNTAQKATDDATAKTMAATKK